MFLAVVAWLGVINTLNAELNRICHLLALLGAHHILHISRVRVKEGRWALNVAQRETEFKKKGFKVAWWGLFQHCSRRLTVLLPPNEFLHSSPEVPRTIQARETSASEGRNYYQDI